MDETVNTQADPAYGNGGGRAGGFHNIDQLPEGKLLQVTQGRSKKSKGRKESLVRKLQAEKRFK